MNMEFLSNLEIYPHILIHDFLRYFMAAGLAYIIFWKWGRHKWEHLIIQRSLPQAKKIWFEFRYSLSTVLIFSLVGFGIVLLEKGGYTTIYYQIGEYGWTYFFLSFLIVIILHDLYFYWTHRWMHHPRIFKYVHKVHHQSTNPSPWAAYSFHPLEALIQAGFYPILLGTIPYHPIVLFIFLIFMITKNVMGHLGFEIFPSGFLKWTWFNWHTTPTHHNLHHKGFNYNYGLYFTWWDDLMGTTDPVYYKTFNEVRSRVCKYRSQKKVKLKRWLLKLSISLVLICPSLFGFSQSVTGNWMTLDEETGYPRAIIRIDSSQYGIEGMVSKLVDLPYEGTDPVCLKCPGRLEGKKVLGMTFIWGFKRNNNEWVQGKILDPANGEIYQSKLWLEDDTTLKVRGYAGPMNLFFRTQTWVRMDKKVRSDSPLGLWVTIDDETGKAKSLIEISYNENQLKGVIKEIFLLSNQGPDRVCKKCDGERKGQKIVGMKILWGFKQGLDQWADGRILDPGNGQIYPGILRLNDEDELKVRGFWGPFFRTQIWKRVSSDSDYPY